MGAEIQARRGWNSTRAEWHREPATARNQEESLVNQASTQRSLSHDAVSHSSRIPHHQHSPYDQLTNHTERKKSSNFFFLISTSIPWRDTIPQHQHGPRELERRLLAFRLPLWWDKTANSQFAIFGGEWWRWVATLEWPHSHVFPRRVQALSKNAAVKLHGVKFDCKPQNNGAKKSVNFWQMCQ